jgi:GT2 family glycosyltransferase
LTSSVSQELMLSIVIVHYNTLELTRACLESIRRECSDVSHEVFLVDNGSTDDSSLKLKQEFPEIERIRYERGIGFGAANNRAAMQATGRYLLILNSDTEIQNKAVSRVIEFLEEHPKAALAGCRLIKDDGEMDRACRRSFPTPLVSFYKLLGLNVLFPRSPRFAAYDLRHMPVDGRYQVDSLVGAFMIGRREVLGPMPFDEEYFFYGEDIDLCYTVKEKGHEVWYLGDITMLHRKGGTTNKREPWVIYHFHDSMRIFYWKHYQQKYLLPVTVLVYTGIYLRMALMLLLNSMKRRRPE